MAVVSVPRKSGCEGCSAGTCRTADQSMEIEAVNRADAKVGQKVRVSIRPSLYMKGSMIVYGIPAVGLVVGAVIGKEVLPGFFPGKDPDLLSAAAGFACLVLFFLGVRLWSVRAGDKTESKPVVEEILS